MSIELNLISKSFNNINVFKDFNVKINDLAITSILGHTGCGKTTLLNMIANIIKPDSGTIDGIENKQISFIFQEPRLIPWLTVKENIEFVLTENLSLHEKHCISTKFISMLSLQQYALHYPHELSGGTKNKVAIARAFGYPSDIILMDEPFNGIDLPQKESLIKAFLELWKNYKRTVIFVTHDIDEAMVIGNNILIMNNKPIKIVKEIIINDKDKDELSKFKKEIKSYL
jgi:NitT/TauT family transport system ATP-binding protein